MRAEFTSDIFDPFAGTGTTCYPSQSQPRQETTLSIESIRQEIKAEIGKLQQVLALLDAETGHGVAKTGTASLKPRR
jgi:hypothetical protein